jgi:hypothetical protein
MKPIRPVYREEVTPTYPTIVDLAHSRRGFLKSTVAGAAAVGGWLLGGGDSFHEAQARPRWRKVNLQLTSRYRFKGCSDRYVDKLVVQTHSRRLERFLRDRREAAGLEHAVLQVLKAHTCDDLQDQKRLARLEGRLAMAIAMRYRSRRRRPVNRPLVTLVLTKWVRPPTLGFISSFPPPVPRP